ncbi:MAG: 4Fe-4S dicluster domain-containing protein [Clostridiales bacterium]|nr:4Fe-4S dicluster domain-containing protein [Clostridiales bacterium]
MRDAPPPCVSACPLEVDVRGMVAKVQAGKLGAAFRAYREAVLFPHVVSEFCDAPCRGVCVRERLSDGYVDLPAIEREVVAGGAKGEGSRYAMPKKKERVAVMGDGLAGLACAWRLASKGYAVTVVTSGAGQSGALDFGLGQGLRRVRRGAAERLATASQSSASASLPETPCSASCLRHSTRSPGYEPQEEELRAAQFAEAFIADRDDLFRYVECEWREGGAGRLANVGGYDAVFESVAVQGEGGVAGEIARGLAAAAAIEEGFRIGDLSGAKPDAGAHGALDFGAGRTDSSSTIRRCSTADSENSKCDGVMVASQCESRRTIGCDPQDPDLRAARPEANGSPVNERFYGLEYDFGGGSEAERCPMCNCSLCIDACPMIRKFKQNPKRMAADLGVSVLPVGGKIMRVGSRMMNSCNLCGLCTAVCPAGVDTRTAMDSSRRILKEGGHMAPAYHSFWMEDFEHAMSDEAYGVVGEAPCKVLFFPGCQLTASLPDVVARTFDYICEREPAAMLLSCCGVPADWAAEREVFSATVERLRAEWERLGRPEAFFACSACKKVFEGALPEVRGRLVYEWLAEQGLGSDLQDTGQPGALDTDVGQGLRRVRRGAAKRLAAASQSSASASLSETPCSASCLRHSTRSPGSDTQVPDLRAAPCPATDTVPRPAAVYDPCNSRDDAEGREAVRRLAERCGYALEELTFAGEKAACCGFGGHIYSANAALLDEILEERAADLPGLPRIAYCANCRDLFLYKGMECAHILEYIFLDEGRARVPAPLPTLSERRENRCAIKARYAGDGGRPCVSNSTTLTIPPEVEAKMDRLLLLREDVEKAVAHCEAENTKLLDPETGRFIGCYRERLLTVWVEYELGADGRVHIHNVYTHRMKIEG